MDTHTFAVIATSGAVFGLVSRRLETSVLPGPMIFASFGLFIGGAVLQAADLDFEHGFIHGVAEITLVLVLFSDAVPIDLPVVRRDHDLPSNRRLACPWFKRSYPVFAKSSDRNS